MLELVCFTFSDRTYKKRQATILADKQLREEFLQAGIQLPKSASA